MKEPSKSKWAHFSWLGFFIHFVFGLIIGGLGGLYYLGPEATSWTGLSLVVLIPGFIIGTLGGFYGDEFWRALFYGD